jgi:prolyl-tRNA editing enzyme YbaK/EbsC (Cys-tRNA(Pro) deacylase)
MMARHSESVRKVRAALTAAGLEDKIVELAATARTAEDAAQALKTELGSIVKSLVFKIGDNPVMALVAGDHKVKPDQLPRAFFLKGDVKALNADEVRDVTGFAIGGVAPVGLPAKIPTVLDVSLKRFPTVYAAAGHPHCVFATSVEELKRLTGCIVSYAIAEKA